MLSNAQNAIYINLNVDEMLPCYSMNAKVEDEECELADRDLRPSLIGVREGEGVNTDGYQTLEAGACSDRDDDDDDYDDDDDDDDDDDGIQGGYISVEEKGEDSSIASDDVVVLGAAGVAAVGPRGVATCEDDNEEETRVWHECTIMLCALGCNNTIYYIIILPTLWMSVIDSFLN